MIMAWNEVAGKGVPGLGIYFEGREKRLNDGLNLVVRKRADSRMNPRCWA